MIDRNEAMRERLMDIARALDIDLLWDDTTGHVSMQERGRRRLPFVPIWLALQTLRNHCDPRYTLRPGNPTHGDRSP